MTTEAASTEYKFPLPEPNALTEPFWEAAKQHVLQIQQCGLCDLLVWYPREFCPRCMSPRMKWVPVSGKGHVYSFSIIRQAAHPAFNEIVPYIYCTIQLAEGPHMIGNLLCPVEEARIGAPVEVVFDDVTPEVTLVKWKPAE